MYIKRILLVIVIAGMLVGGAFAFMVYRAFFVPNTQFGNEVAYVFIPSNSDFQEVKSIMEPLLKDLKTFESAADKKGYSTNIKAGKYAIKKGMSNNDIVNSLRSQIEADSIALLSAFGELDFLKANGFNDKTALSMYIPNSYEFFWNTSAEGFRERMLKEYKRFWNEERIAKSKSLGLNSSQVITLASIVHKETAKVDERPRVAGVYLNRLATGMLLQADPTVIYAIKLHTGNFDTIIKRVLYKDLELDSPYNTYKYAGLPPGPIAMPDISAIDAVLNPEKHDYYYFVANVEDFGYHKFAKTLTQHNRNKEQYVRWINSQKINR